MEPRRYGRPTVFSNPARIEFRCDAQIRDRYLALASERQLLPGQLFVAAVELLEFQAAYSKGGA